MLTQDPRMCVVFIQTELGVQRSYIVMDFHHRALRYKKPRHIWLSWRALYPSEAKRLLSETTELMKGKYGHYR